MLETLQTALSPTSSRGEPCLGQPHRGICVEATELLRAAPGDLAGAVRMGGRPMDWIWKAGSHTDRASICARLGAQGELPELVYSLASTESGGRFEIVEEALEQAPESDPNRPAALFYYKLREGRPVIRTRAAGASFSERALPRESIHPEQSVLRQKRDQEHDPERFGTAKRFEAVTIFREWDVSAGGASVCRRVTSNGRDHPGNSSCIASTFPMNLYRYRVIGAVFANYWLI